MTQSLWTGRTWKTLQTESTIKDRQAWRPAYPQRLTNLKNRFMKPESLKHLQLLHSMCSEDMGAFKEVIEAIIRIESEPKTKSKFKIWEYVSDDMIRPAMCHIYHDKGFKVASDGHILIAVKEDYEPILEGRLMLKNGVLAPEDAYRYPKWRDVIPNTELMEMVPVKLDFEKIKGFESDFKAKMKAANRKYATTSVQVTENCGFKLEYLVKMAKVMEYIGTDVLMVNADGRRAALASTDMGKALLMPIMGYEDAEFRYKL